VQEGMANGGPKRPKKKYTATRSKEPGNVKNKVSVWTGEGLGMTGRGRGTELSTEATVRTKRVHGDLRGGHHRDLQGRTGGKNEGGMNLEGQGR